MPFKADRARLFPALITLSLMPLLGGCATYHAAAGNGFSSAGLSDASAKSGIPFQVDGKVGGVQGEPLATAVGAAMPASMKYAACAPYTECPGDHLVWTFGPPDARPRSAYPAGLAYNLNWIGGYEPAPNNVTAKVALFQGGNVVASASGQTDAASPNDPAFQAMIAQMSSAVLSGPDIFDAVGFP
jgi:hypothetical protein